MGIYIEGVSVPDACKDCCCFQDEYWYCMAKDKTIGMEEYYHRPEWCPINVEKSSGKERHERKFNSRS